jgi:PAS domain S-box-containing protein
MLALPADFSGTRGIIHPDDLQRLKDTLSLLSQTKSINFQFRIITTYGEVKYLTGHQISLSTDEEPLTAHPEIEVFLKERKLLELQKENDQLKIKKEIWESSERIHKTGTWCFNMDTNTVWYSDQVFRIFGLPPQSLNAHLNTFNAFIHPDDKAIVTEAFDKAYKEQVPLHLKYRIYTANGELKKISQVTQWHSSFKGERLLSGIIQDETEFRELEHKTELFEQDLALQKQMILLDEQNTQKGFWYINLATRKTVFSDACYRLFGIKQKTTSAGINTFINYVHPDDQERVEQAYTKMFEEQELPELEFRIIRNEGRTRYIKQIGKVINHDGDQIIIGTFQDITAQIQTSLKLKELKESLAVRSFVAAQQEEISHSGNWVWDLQTGQIIWSDGMYNLLGFKPGSEELTQKHLLALIHRDDRNKFTEELAAFLAHQKESEFEFRLTKQGGILQMRASFRLFSLADKNFFIGTIRDLSKKFLLKQQLQQRIQLTESIAENLMELVFLTDSNNTVLLWNNACEKVYKVRREEVVGKNLFEVFPQLKNPQSLALFQTTLNGEEIHQVHIKSAIVNGYFNLSMIPLKDEREMVWGVLHLLHDVTKEHELQRNLNERLNFIESLVESSVDRIIVMDPDMNYIVWNRRCEEYYGLKKEEVIGKNILEVFPGAINHTSYQNFKRVLKGETVFIPANEKGQENQQHEEIYLIPILNERADVTAVLWVIHDLTKDIELSRQKNKAFEILNSLNENYFELDHNYRFSFVNQKGQEFFQLPEEEMLGKTLWNVFPYVLGTPIHQAIIQAMEEKVPIKGEFLSPIKQIPILVTMSPTYDGVAVAFFDIGFIKETQQKLAEEHERLKEVQAIGHIGSFEWDLKTNQMFWNEELYNICCVPSDEKMTFEQAFEFYNPETRNNLFDLFSYSIKTGEPFEVEDKFIRTDGELRYVFMRAVVIKNEAGEPQKLRGIVQDITERKLLEAKTKENEYFLRQIEDATPDAIAIFDFESDETVYLNQAFAAMTGYSAQELIEMGFEGRMDVMTHPEDREIIYDLHRMMVSASDEDIVTIQYRVIRKDGSVCQIKSRSKVFKRNEAGQPTRILSVLQDMTQEIELNKELSARIRFIEALADNSVDGILVLDKEKRIMLWNRKCEEVFHMKKKDATGRPFLELFPKLKEDAIVMEAIQRSYAGEFVHIPQQKNIYSNGYSELFYIPLLDVNNVIYGTLQISHDISKRVEDEEELKELNRTLEKKNKELEEKQEEISQFAFVASHDLKEPLRKIHTFSDFLLQKEDLSLPPTEKTFLKKINASVKRMDMLIEDILVLTKINSEKKLERTVDLNKVLKNIKEEMKELIRTTGTEIVGVNLPQIKGNENQLFHLFKNLIGNAIKFQVPDNKPEIHITGEVIAGKDSLNDKLDPEKNYFKISFEDNGLGFEPKYAKKIFGIFQRLHGKQEFEGTGMGLAICKKIVENHNGFIEAFSTPGKGSVFTCFFEVK